MITNHYGCTRTRVSNCSIHGKFKPVPRRRIPSSRQRNWARKGAIDVIVGLDDYPYQSQRIGNTTSMDHFISDILYHIKQYRHKQQQIITIEILLHLQQSTKQVNMRSNWYSIWPNIPRRREPNQLDNVTVQQQMKQRFWVLTTQRTVSINIR